MSLTEAGKVMGTPQYMAPEQSRHPREVDHRADIYSLGVVFYQMLTGELPGKPIEPPSQKVQMDVRLDEVVLRALEKEPERRYQQVSEVKTRGGDDCGKRAAHAAPARSPFAYFWEDVFPGCTSWPRFKNRYIRFLGKLFGDVTSSGGDHGFSPVAYRLYRIRRISCDHPGNAVVSAGSGLLSHAWTDRRCLCV